MVCIWHCWLFYFLEMGRPYGTQIKYIPFFRWIEIQRYNMNRGYATSMRFKFKIPVQFKSIVFFVGLNPTLQNG
jgi:hypothetical protein